MTHRPEKRPMDRRHRGDDYIDEIRIITRERYKTSGLSGDEWRFHRVIQLFRKGKLLWERPFNGSMQSVAAFLPWMMVEAFEGDQLKRPEDSHLCFQPGCPDPAISEYELIEEFGPQGQRLHPEEQGTAYHSLRRRFCRRHLRRGDAGREDSDANYRVLAGPGPDGADFSGATISEARRVDVQVETLAELPDAIRRATR